MRAASVPALLGDAEFPPFPILAEVAGCRRGMGRVFADAVRSGQRP